MRVFSKKVLREFWELHADARASLETWCKLARRADWATPNDVRETFRTADPIGGEIVVFDVANNRYRLVATVQYARRTVWVYGVYTHAEYDRLDLNGGGRR